MTMFFLEVLGENPLHWLSVQFSSVQSLSRVRLFVASWTAARQASLSVTNSQSLLKLMSIELVMPSSHLIFTSFSCGPLLPSSKPATLYLSSQGRQGRQRILACCSPWSLKELDVTERLSNNNNHSFPLTFPLTLISSGKGEIRQNHIDHPG